MSRRLPIRPFRDNREELKFWRRVEQRYPVDAITQLLAHGEAFNAGILAGARILRKMWKKKQGEAIK